MLKFFKKMKKNRKGYTLTELIVVVAILGILAAVATPMIMGQIGKANTTADLANAKAMENAIAISIADETNSLPIDLDDAEKAITNQIGSIPPIKDENNHFLLNLKTGKIEVVPTTTAVVTGTTEEVAPNVAPSTPSPSPST